MNIILRASGGLGGVSSWARERVAVVEDRKTRIISTIQVATYATPDEASPGLYQHVGGQDTTLAGRNE